MSVTQNIRLPRDYFLGWCLFVRMYFSVAQNIRLPMDYFFFGWHLFVCHRDHRDYYWGDGVFLCASICQLHKIYVCLGTIFLYVIHLCPGKTFLRNSFFLSYVDYLAYICYSL